MKPLWVAFCLFAFFFHFPMFQAEAGEKGITLEESGIRYPEGFDLNTVGEVQGKAVRFSRSEKGPLQFYLLTERESYIVLTSPPWYWKESLPPIPEGSEVRVRGSKTVGRDGRLYIIAQELRLPSMGRHFLFRDNEGRPLWRERGRLEREAPGGMDPFSRGGERFGLGGGGPKGHGRR